MGKAVQLAIYNTDSLELRIQRQQLDALNRIENKLPGRARGRAHDSRSGGDFGGDEGAGGSFDEGSGDAGGDF